MGWLSFPQVWRLLFPRWLSDMLNNFFEEIMFYMGVIIVILLLVVIWEVRKTGSRYSWG